MKELSALDYLIKIIRTRPRLLTLLEFKTLRTGNIISVLFYFMLQNTLWVVGGKGERRKRQIVQLWKYKKTTGMGTTEDFLLYE